MPRSFRLVAFAALAFVASGCSGGGGGGGGGGNHAPEGVDDAATTGEDTPVDIDATANDTDADDDVLLVRSFTEAANGTVSIQGDGTLLYTPDPDFNGTDTFTYVVTDGPDDGETPATVTITVNAAGDIPVAAADSYSATEDALLTIDATAGVLGNDSDSDSSFTAVLDNTTADGTLTLAADGSFTYQPDANFDGTDTFQYHATDGTDDSSIVTVTIAVAGVNDAPVAVADGAYTTAEETALVVSAANGVISGTGTDTDADGDTLVAILGTAPTHGTVALAANGSFTYTPALNYAGADSFTYSAWDGTVASNTVTVSLTVTNVNDAPVAAGDQYSMLEDSTLAPNAAAGVLANDSDVETVAIDAQLVSGPANASSFTLDPNGSFSYTPNANFFGFDNFTYRAFDGSLQSGVVTVIITIVNVNDAPTASDETPGYSTNEDTALVVGAATGVLVNDVDLDGQPLDALLQTPPAHGSVALDANGAFTYAPATNYNGPDSFEYFVRDGVLSTLATAHITVNAVNDAPTALPESYVTSEDTTLSVAAPGVLANDSDPETAFSVSLESLPSHAESFSINGNGAFSYTPEADFAGVDSFTYSAGDGQVTSTPVTVTITVAPVNDPPSFVSAGDVSIAEDAAAYAAAWATSISPGPSNESAQAVSFEVTAGNTAQFSAQPAVSASGMLTFTIASNFFGTAPVTVVAVDSLGGRSAATVFHVVVSNVNDAPTLAFAGDRTVAEDSGPSGESGFAAFTAGPGGEPELFTVFTYDYDGSLFAINGQPHLDLDGTLTFEPAPDAFGTTTVFVNILDQFGLVNTSSFQITITPVNDAPSFTVGANQPAFDDGVLHTVPGFITNMSAGPGESGSWTFNVSNEAPVLFDVQPAIDPAGTLTFTPSLGAAPAVITVTVSMTDDGAPPATSGDQTFTINLADPSNPPEFVSSSPANGALLSQEEAFSPGNQLVPMSVTFDDPTLDCATLTVDATGSVSGAIPVSSDCVTAPGIVFVVFSPFSTPQDGETVTVDLTNIQDGEVPPNVGAPVSISFLFDSQAPTPNFVDDIESPGCRGANSRLIAMFDEPIDTATDSSFSFVASPSNVPVIVEPDNGRGFSSYEFPDDTFHFVPRDLLAAGNYTIDVSGFRDPAGNASTRTGQTFSVCGGSASGTFALDRVELKNALIVDQTIDDSSVSNRFTVAAPAIAGTDDDVDVVFTQTIAPAFTAELKLQSGSGNDTTVTGAANGATIHFDLAAVPGFHWSASTEAVVEFNGCGMVGGCLSEHFTIRVANATDAIPPEVVAVTSRRASASDPAIPAFRLEEPIRIGFSEAVDRRTLTSANVRLLDSLGNPVAVVFANEERSGVDSEQVTLRADRGDGRPGALAAGTYTVSVSGVKDLGSPSNTVASFTKDIEVSSAGFGTPTLLYGTNFVGDADPSAGKVFVAFSDAMSRSAFVDTGDPGVTPHGFRLDEILDGPFGQVVVPLKGLSPFGSSADGSGEEDATEPEVVTLSLSSCCAPNGPLNGFRTGGSYSLTVFGNVHNIDGAATGGDASGQFTVTSDYDDVTPTFTEFSLDFEIFEPGTLLLGGDSLESRGRPRVRFEDNDVFGNANAESVTLTLQVTQFPSEATNTIDFGPAQTLEFSENTGASLDAADLAGLFAPGDVHQVDYVLVDDATNFNVGSDLLYYPSEASPAPSASFSGSTLTVTGTIAAVDGPFVDHVEVGIAVTDESGALPDILGLTLVAMGSVTRDDTTGAITYTMASDVALPALPAPYAYRAFAVASYPPLLSTVRGGINNFSLPGATFAGNAPPPPPPRPFFLEYVEGTAGGDKAIEIYNPRLTPLNLAAEACTVKLYSNGSVTGSAPISLTGTVASGDVYVLCTSSPNAAFSTACDQITGSLNHNGDDAIELSCNGTRLDLFGQIGTDPGTQWGAGTSRTADNTLVKSCLELQGDVVNDPFVPADQWVGIGQNVFTDVGTASCIP